MKKLIAILVVFALVAGSIFAADIGVDVFGNVVLADGSSELDSAGDPAKPDATASGGNGRIRISASAEKEDGTFGGWLRFNAGSYGGGVDAFGYVWWKPIDQFKFQIGTNGGDGEFALEGITGWGFYCMPCEVIISNGNVWGWGGALANDGKSTRFRNAFYGGFNSGAILTITPADMVAINIGIPFYQGGKGEKIYKETTGQVAFDIEGIGKAGITYEGGMNEVNFDPANPESFDGSGSKLFAYFGLSAVENLGIDIGVGFTFPVKDDDLKLNYNAPVAIGLGASYNMDAFGVNFRAMVEVGGKRSGDAVKGYLNAFGDGDDSVSTPFAMLLDVLPSFAVNDNLKVFLSFGLGMVGENKYKANGADVKEDSLLTWHVEPYIVVGNQWSAAFYAGFRLESPTDKGGKKGEDSYINWSIPLGMTIGF